MKKFQTILFLTICFIWSNNLLSQNRNINNSTNTHTYNQCTGYLYDSGTNTNYGNNQDYWVAICPGTQGNRISMYFEEFSIDNSDKIEIYSGIGLNGSIHVTAGNTPFFTGNDLLNKYIVAYPTDTTGCLTTRIISDGSLTSTGFKAKIECVNYCQFPEASLDTFFYKIDNLGNRTQTLIRNFIDTVWNDSLHTSYKTAKFKAIDICYKDSIELVAKVKFPEDSINYIQSPNNCIYYWNYGDGNIDTIQYNNLAQHSWSKVYGYDINLIILDTLNGGCRSRNTIDTRLRIARNPIKTVSPIPDMCSGQLFDFTVGYNGNNAINIDSIKFQRPETKVNDSIVFIPDGPNCSANCYEAPVYFTSFLPGAVVTSLNDIKSICVNMEHTYIGDLSMEIICPNNSSTIFKHFTQSGSSDLGLANGSNNGCFAVDNAQGIGWTYCWSNQYLNSGMGVINGNTMGSPIPATDIIDTLGYFQTPIQNATSMITGWETVDLNGFSPLIGCPLNGEWKLKICDYWAGDNGYVFYWNMSLGQKLGADWDYQVGIDTVILDGSFIVGVSDTSLRFAPPIDSCGLYLYNIHIIDDFGCMWDTVTNLKVVCTPQVNLGSDTAICENINIILDAGNQGASSYIWEPNGENTQTITAKSAPNSNSATYVALVTNHNDKIYCYGQDSINLIIYPAVTANFSSSINPMEGCEPFTVKLTNSSMNAAYSEWNVGQLKSNDNSPTFTLPYGTYDIHFKVTSLDGCKDSIILNNIINVYKSPIANFGWTPQNPSVTLPTASFINLTTPKDIYNVYHWKIQRNALNDLRDNIFGEEPNYTWANTGDFNISLDAYSVNTAPSGFVYECHDTISKIITIINDVLIFPNVITPNGDGVNDLFVIKNLVDGQAYPDNEISIYNRNGKCVFFKQDVRTNEELWKPNSDTPTGTYFYKFIARGPIRNIEYDGAVEIIK